MVDLYLSFGVMFFLCGLAAFAGASLQARARRAIVLTAEIVVCCGTAAYLNYLWDRPILSRLLPFSGAIILGNWLPIIGAFFMGVCLKTNRVSAVSRAVLAGSMVGISGYSFVSPMLGSPPACQPGAFDRTLDFQTTNSTCSSACAANLLKLHGIPATEEEMAELCLTRRGTHWLGVYRGLKLKTAETDWDVNVEEIRKEDLFSDIHGLGILALSFHTLESGRIRDPEWGFAADVGHSVLVLRSHAPATLDIFDPAPDYGFETWDEAVLAKVRNGILLRLIPRDGTEHTVPVDMKALRRGSSAYPPLMKYRF